MGRCWHRALVLAALDGSFGEGPYQTRTCVPEPVRHSCKPQGGVSGKSVPWPFFLPAPAVSFALLYGKSTFSDGSCLTLPDSPSALTLLAGSRFRADRGQRRAPLCSRSCPVSAEPHSHHMQASVLCRLPGGLCCLLPVRQGALWTVGCRAGESGASLVWGRVDSSIKLLWSLSVQFQELRGDRAACGS